MPLRFRQDTPVGDLRVIDLNGVQAMLTHPIVRSTPWLQSAR
jgi:hypothetical protein